MERLRKYIRKILSESELENNLNDNFNKWFAGSKVVDASGNPLVVYHGTSKKFSKFNLKNAPQPIIWFTSNKSTFKDDASGASGAAGKGHVMELYANIKNPAYWEEYEKYGLGQLKGLGYDGVILPEGNTFDGFVFEPNQLKSVTNKGEWNIGNKNIFKEEKIGRELGKSLAQQIKTPFVIVYRAAPMSSNEFFDRDFVTLSKKFAIEHSENNHIYHEEPQHVIQALISTKNLFDAPNPGEYFYSGPNKKAKEIYVTKGHDYEGLDEQIEKNDKIIFLRNVNYSNKGSIRKLPYEGIHCWAVKESDLDKFFEQAYYQGSDKKDFVEIKPEGKKIYALNFKVADDYVKGNSDLKPEIEKFNPNKHTLKFKKVSGKSMYSYHSDLDYQILMNPERIN